MVLDTDLVFVAANEAYCKGVRRPESALIGQYVFDVFTEPTEDLIPSMENFQRTLAGEVVRLDAVRFPLKLANGQFKYRFLQVSQYPIRCEKGDVEFIVQRSEDVTEREKLRQERDLVTAELNHRVRNTLAVVQSVAEHSGLVAKDYQSFLDSFQGRLAAIGRNFAALSETHWQGLDFGSVLRAELEPYAGPAFERISIEGPPLTLNVKATKDTSMLLHELITNASKHGFLSRRDGRLSVRWTVEDNVFRVNWCESGMAGILPPSRTGFGFQLFDLMPNIRLEKKFAPDGLKLKFEVPVEIVANELIFASR